MNWIEVNRWQDVPHNGNYIYTIRRADPYTLNHNNGQPEYFVTRYSYNLEMFESVIAYAEVEPYIPER